MFSGLCAGRRTGLWTKASLQAKLILWRPIHTRIELLREILHHSTSFGISASSVRDDQLQWRWWLHGWADRKVLIEVFQSSLWNPGYLGADLDVWVIRWFSARSPSPVSWGWSKRPVRASGINTSARQTPPAKQVDSLRLCFDRGAFENASHHFVSARDRGVSFFWSGERVLANAPQ